MRLISGAFYRHEVFSLLETIFASKDEIQIIRNLHRDPAEALINVLHKVCLCPPLLTYYLTTFSRVNC